MDLEVLVKCLTGYTTIVFTVVALLLIARFYKNSENKAKGQLPPGPTGWPILGYIKFVMAEIPVDLMLQLKEKYGNVFGFRVGKHYCVMLSDYKSVREAFTKNHVLDRPPKYMRMSAEHKTMNELNGKPWEEQRAFLVQSLKAIGIGRPEFEYSVQNELSRVIFKMEKLAGKSECNIRDVISCPINNMVFKLICGRVFEEDHPLMKSFLRFQILLVESFSNNMALIYFPWLDWFLAKFDHKMKETLKSAAVMENFIRSELTEREKVHIGSGDQDYMDVFLTEQKRRLNINDVASFTGHQLVYNALTILLAGTDTVRNTMEWLLMIIAELPEVQRKIHAEIDCVLGRERAPQYSDKTNLPYTEAVILESERWKTLLPLNILRVATEDTHIQGFFIPKDTVMINNMQNCHMDKTYWESPEEFLPERFLSADKTRVVVPEYFMPFSIGRRSCPGDKMTKIVIFIFLTSLMQKFKFSPPDGGVDFSASHRLNLQAHKPIVKVELR